MSRLQNTRQTPSARETLVIRCIRCHAPQGENGKLDAIEAQRKSPEGWSMTLSRMVRTHGVELQDGDARILVKYLSDHYGLAPKEVEPYRFIPRTAQYPHHAGRAQAPPGWLYPVPYLRTDRLAASDAGLVGAAAGRQGRTHGEYRQ